MKNSIKLLVISVVGLLAIFLAGVFLVNGVQNKAIALEEQVESSSSDIKIQEKRRVDLVYNLVSAVQEYDSHEYHTLMKVADDRIDNDAVVEQVTTMIRATAEAYPDLKSSENYKQLMTELSLTENMIAQYRSTYNVQVKNYNRYVRKYPNSLFLSMLGYEQLDAKYLDYSAPVDAPQDIFKKE